jgi:protein TonB
MEITKFDLCNPEWLEIVFDSKNKEYGAYDLRKHYAQNLVKAMAIAFFSVAFLYMAYSILKPKPAAFVPTIVETPVTLMSTDVKPPVIVPPKPQVTHPQVQVNTVKYPIFVAKPDKDAENPPKLTDLETSAIGTKAAKGKNDDGGTGTAVIFDGPPVDPGVTEDNTPKDMASVEVLPEPYGGATAWQKFLQKNIHYPPQASEAGVQGKVFLSFIVEMDGRLSNITVERGIGSGLSEEAVRVLKLAPAWKPGIQNGHKVRVKYTIPINFVIPDSE